MYIKGGLQLKNVVVQVLCETMGKIYEKDKQKAKKFSPVINQMPTPRLEHFKIWTQLSLGIMSKSMLEKVWWCKFSEMEF